MNKKLIVAAVGAALAPLGAHADASWYGRINNAIDLDSKGDESTTDISGVASRIGVKYSGEIGSGLTAHGRYEFSTSTDNEGGGINDTRIATVGISGLFGSLNVGNQWSSFFNTFGTMVSPTYSLGYYLYSSVGGGPFRASNTIQYSNNFGPMYFTMDVRFNDSGAKDGNTEKIDGEGFGVGISVPLSDTVSIAAAVDTENGAKRAAVKQQTGVGIQLDGTRVTWTDADGKETADPVTVHQEAADAADADTAPDTDRVGFAAKIKLPNGMAIQGGWQGYELGDDKRTAANDPTKVDTYFVWGSGSFGPKSSWLLGYSEADMGDSSSVEDPTQLTWGLYYNLGAGLKMYYEATSLEGGSKKWDGEVHLLGMRVDF